MTAAELTDEQLDDAGVLCHCADDEQGHALGTDGCAATPLRSSTPRRFAAGPTAAAPGASACHGTDLANSARHPRLRPYRATGECPECGSPRPVERVGVYGDSPLAARPLLLAREPRIAEHAVKGQAQRCPGGIPVELTFRPGTEVAGFAAAYGEHLIFRSTK